MQAQFLPALDNGVAEGPFLRPRDNDDYITGLLHAVRRQLVNSFIAAMKEVGDYRAIEIDLACIQYAVESTNYHLSDLMEEGNSVFFFSPDADQDDTPVPIVAPLFSDLQAAAGFLISKYAEIGRNYRCTVRPASDLNAN